MVMTTSNSTSVKPVAKRERAGCTGRAGGVVVRRRLISMLNLLLRAPNVIRLLDAVDECAGDEVANVVLERIAGDSETTQTSDVKTLNQGAARCTSQQLRRR